MGTWNLKCESPKCSSAQLVQGGKRAINFFQLIYHFKIAVQNESSLGKMCVRSLHPLFYLLFLEQHYCLEGVCKLNTTSGSDLSGL